jgi:predicted nucleic acid-binding protein
MEVLKNAKYIIDTSALLSQKSDERYRRNIFKTLWNLIDNMIQDKTMVTCSEIISEVEDEDIKNWLVRENIQVLPIDDEIQENVREIVTNVNPALIDFKNIKSSGDAFLIATAKKYNLTVITEESAKSNKKIPYTCQLMGIKCLSLLTFMEENNISL